MRKVIFLDIDGVLNRDDGKDYFVDEFLENLAAIVKETGARGAIIGNVLMRMWDDEEKCLALLEKFQSLAE